MVLRDLLVARVVHYMVEQGGGTGGEIEKMSAQGFSIIAIFIGKPSGSP